MTNEQMLQRYILVLKAEVKKKDELITETQNKYDEIYKEKERESERCAFWEKTGNDYSKKYDEAQKLLTEAHAIIGRSAHALSKRWDSMPLTVYMKGFPPGGN